MDFSESETEWEYADYSNDYLNCDEYEAESVYSDDSNEDSSLNVSGQRLCDESETESVYRDDSDEDPALDVYGQRFSSESETESVYSDDSNEDPCLDVYGQRFYGESESESVYSDDSTEDPSFDDMERDTRVAFSHFSIRRNPKLCVGEKSDEEAEDYTVIEGAVPELDEQRPKTYGRVEKLKVEDCKVYLKEHGLRLSGNKETLTRRIKEHIDILNGGGGEKKYPPSSFEVNCRGDACMGDVVMFEQNVYDDAGRFCGTRTVGGRIVKESYGAAKQQHTFTVELLWSKGEKPLPPLHPLRIKGRNLYRKKTLRQRWDNEEERQKILSEKHERGDIARSNREARIRGKETQKTNHQARNVPNPPKPFGVGPSTASSKAKTSDKHQSSFGTLVIH